VLAHGLEGRWRSELGDIAGAALAFALARWFGRPFVDALLNERHRAAMDRWTRRQGVGVLLCALSAALWIPPAFATEWDDIFAASSLLVVGFVLAATALMARAPRAPAPS